MTILELLGGAEIDFVESGNHHCRPGWIQLEHCPFCGSRKYHLGYNLQAHYFNCWKCGGHHVVSTLVKLGFGYKEAQDFWKSGDPGPRPSERKRTELVEPPGRSPLLGAHRRYLRGRGFNPDEIERLWKLEAIGIAARLAWRLYIPIHLNGERVSWTTRAIGSKVEQRYISAAAEEEAINHKHLIYGADYCAHSIVIVEGPTDAWKIGPGAGALFGTAFSSAQVRRLLRFPYRFVCFDSSREAQAKARELAGQLSVFPGTTTNLEIEAPDPGSAPEKELKLVRKVARLA